MNLTAYTGKLSRSCRRPKRKPKAQKLHVSLNLSLQQRNATKVTDDITSLKTESVY